MKLLSWDNGSVNKSVTSQACDHKFGQPEIVLILDGLGSLPQIP